MKVSKNESGAVGLIAVALIVGLVIGFAVTRVADNHNKKSDDAMSSTSSSSSAPTSATKAADLRSTLVTLGVEHMILTDAAVDAALDGSKDAAAVDTALNTNGTDIGAAVGSVYGADAQKTFDSVWQYHLDQFVAYAVADSKGDATGKQTALNNISTGYTKPLAQYLAKANPNLPEATLESLLGDHVAMTATIIDDHVAGKYPDEQAELKMANEHIEGIFSALAGGIVKQFPSKFQG